jgi:DNA-binding CsgD family transcriptional regulator
MIARGYSQKQMAEELNTSEHSINRNTRDIREKTGTQTNAHAVVSLLLGRRL